MAPLQEDFVLTISDNEDDVPNLDEEELALDDAPSTKGKSNNKKKRKRGNDEPTDLSNTTNGKTKSSKKAKKSKLNKLADLEPEDVSEGDEDELAWEAQGEDDGTMNPDFDFQIGDSGAGVVEDFDGWGMGRGEQRSATGGDKKAVDIDEIIARRREQSGKGHEVGHDAAVDGEADSETADGTKENLEDGNVTSEVNDEDDEEDELLAEDGFGMGAAAEDENEGGNAAASDQDEDEDEGSSDEESEAAPVSHPDDMALDGQSDEEVEEDPAAKARRDAFFAPEEPTSKSAKSGKGTSIESFQTMSLSRPVLKGLAAVGFSEPTPIQSKTIPVALLGKDVVGGAVTGSGKTAAFLVPILERLLYRPKKVPTSRVAILMPTRELAVQCYNVAKKLSMFTDITFCRLIGGFSLREQESELRLRPDVIIATPGRFIDHMRNSASFTVDTLEILVLDEADRMLEDGFADELNEILTTIPKSRQTMLFSATMTDSVDKLIRVGMTRPVRLLVDARKQTVGTLIQEFVRLRPGREDKRLAYLMLLCKTVYTERVIVFFRQKKEAHRVRVIFGLCGLKAAELHGSMSQDQRIHSVESFRSGASTHLLATDLASRGLDIKGVSTVINYESPQSHEIYLHRVGRTARAGRTGRACTLAAEPDRKVVKAAVRSARSQRPPATVVSRVVDPAEADAWAARLSAMEDEVEAVLAEEKEERQLGQVEQQVRKGENVLAHEKEIMSRPRRTWFESEKEKARAKDRGKLELNGEVGGGKEKKKGKLSGKERKRLEVRDIRSEEGGGWRKGKGKGESSGVQKGAKGKVKSKPAKGHTKGPPKGISRNRS